MDDFQFTVLWLVNALVFSFLGHFYFFRQFVCVVEIIIWLFFLSKVITKYTSIRDPPGARCETNFCFKHIFEFHIAMAVNGRSWFYYYVTIVSTLDLYFMIFFFSHFKYLIYMLMARIGLMAWVRYLVHLFELICWPILFPKCSVE